MSNSILNAGEAFLENIRKSRPANTYRNYKSDLLGRNGFIASLAPIKPSADVKILTEIIGADWIQSLLDAGASTATRQRKASVLREFFRFAADESDLPINIEKLNHKIKVRHLVGASGSAIEFPGESIQRVLDHTKKLHPAAGDLRTLRDLALIWTLAETGLRVSEACALKVGDIDSRGRATIIGKGGKQATVRFGKNSRACLSAYLKNRAGLDGNDGRPRASLPLFARHDLTSGFSVVKPIDQKKAEKIIHELTLLALGDEYDPKITCHKLRHYAITMVYRHKGDLKAAQEFARHSNIGTTTRYTHRDSEENARISQEVFG